MKKGLTELVFILDKSGSMGGLEKDTIGGYNSMLEKQKAVPVNMSAAFYTRRRQCFTVAAEKFDTCGGGI